MLTWKLRITVLWIFIPVCQSAGMVLLMFKPGVIRNMMAGKVLGVDMHSAGVQINTALFWLAPMALAYLTLVLKDTANRQTNAVRGHRGHRGHRDLWPDRSATRDVRRGEPAGYLQRGTPPAQTVTSLHRAMRRGTWQAALLRPEQVAALPEAVAAKIRAAQQPLWQLPPDAFAHPLLWGAFRAHG